MPSIIPSNVCSPLVRPADTTSYWRFNTLRGMILANAKHFPTLECVAIANPKPVNLPHFLGINRAQI
ncbi:MAG: hypothetical protein AAFU84_12245 [Cyanobacteria bacterium J06633_23]